MNGPSETKPNPENCKNCSSKCVYDCAQFQYTIQHRTVLIISPLTSRQSSYLRCCLSEEKGVYHIWNLDNVMVQLNHFDKICIFFWKWHILEVRGEIIRTVLCCIVYWKLCTVISTLRWAVLTVLRIGFCLTGRISLCVDSCVYVFFALFCLTAYVLYYCNTVGWTW